MREDDEAEPEVARPQAATADQRESLVVDQQHLADEQGPDDSFRDFHKADSGQQPQLAYPVVNGFITLTREELYELVWSEPMRTLAPQFGLSDVGLAKICRRHVIPRPPVGYWAKKQFGKRVSEKSLPKAVDPQFQTVKIAHVDRRIEDSAAEDEVAPLAQDPEIAALIEKEHDPKNKISVPQRLRTPHPIVENTRRALGKSSGDEHGILHRWRSNGAILNVSVTRASMDRALRIADAFLKAFERRGYGVKAVNHEGRHLLRLEALGEGVSFRLREKVNRKERSTAEREQIRRWRRYDYVPNGLLELKLELIESPEKRVWVDGKRARLEDHIQDVLIGLLVLIDRARSWRKELEEWTRRYREKEQQKLENERRARAQQARYEELEKTAAAWIRSRRLREFVAAVKAEADRRGEAMVTTPELAAWLAWAERYADALDPLASRNPLPRYVNVEAAGSDQETGADSTRDEGAWVPPRQPR